MPLRCLRQLLVVVSNTNTPMMIASQLEAVLKPRPLPLRVIALAFTSTSKTRVIASGTINPA